MNTNFLEGSIAGIIVDGESELFTKSIAREFAFTANQAGCTFPGRPLVEATGSLQNFNVQAKILETDNMGAYEKSARVLVEQILSFSPTRKKQANIYNIVQGAHILCVCILVQNQIAIMEE